MSSNSMKMAVGQLGPIHLADSREAVVARLVSMLREAAAGGCKFIAFPELALTTFFPRYWYDDEAEVAGFYESEMPNAATQPLFDEAARLGIGFYLGYAELTPERRRFNTSVLVGPDGVIVGKYRKVHLPGHADNRPTLPFQHLEKRYFEVGDLGFPTFASQGTTFGMCICNDRRWPEAYRVLAMRGADVVALGYNTPSHNIYYEEPPHLRMFHHRLVMQSAAYQNCIWVLASAKCGAEDGFHMHGGSCIIAPSGEIVAQTSSEDDEVIQHHCDLDLGKRYRKTVFNFARHRRPEHYGLITESAGGEQVAGQQGGTEPS